MFFNCYHILFVFACCHKILNPIKMSSLTPIISERRRKDRPSLLLTTTIQLHYQDILINNHHSASNWNFLQSQFSGSEKELCNLHLANVTTRTFS